MLKLIQGYKPLETKNRDSLVKADLLFVKEGKAYNKMALVL